MTIELFLSLHCEQQFWDMCCPIAVYRWTTWVVYECMGEDRGVLVFHFLLFYFIIITWGLKIKSISFATGPVYRHIRLPCTTSKQTVLYLFTLQTQKFSTQTSRFTSSGRIGKWILTNFPLLTILKRSPGSFVFIPSSTNTLDLPFLHRITSLSNNWV